VGGCRAGRIFAVAFAFFVIPPQKKEPRRGRQCTSLGAATSWNLTPIWSGASCLFSLPLRGACRAFPIGCPVLWSCIGDAPNRPTSVIGDQQRPVLHHCQGGRSSPDLRPMLTRDPEASHEIFVASLRPPILEAHPNNFVAGRLRTVPGTLKRHECIPAIFCWELFALVEYHIQNRRMRLEQYVWKNGCFHFFRRSMCKAWLRVGADICIGPVTFYELLTGALPFTAADPIGI
jgi:hypothetical protein